MLVLLLFQQSDIKESAKYFIEDPTWQAVVVTLLSFIFLFDLHKTAFNFIVNKIKRTNKDHDEWSEKPRRWRLQFPLMVYLKVRKLRKAITEDRLEKLESIRSRMSELFKKDITENTGIEFHYEKFQSRSEIQFDLGIINLINGLPGTGKTTEIVHHIKHAEQYEEALFFYFDHYAVQTIYKSLLEDSQETNVLDTWKVFGKVMLDKGQKKDFYDPNFLSYYFNNKPVVLFFDGFTKIKNIQNLTINLHRYFTTYHAKNKNIKIFLTSRNKNLRDIYVPVAHIWIDAITKEDAEKYFFTKCQEFGLNLTGNRQFHKIIADKNSILRFDHPLTKTPLFVEIVLLIIRENNFDSVVDTFQRSVPHVYRRFVETLYMRSNAKESFNEIFYQKYRALGHAVFGQGNSFSVDDIVKFFKPEDEVNLTFLLNNGLIFEKKVRGRKRYEFIHKSLPDVLFIEQMVVDNKYEALEQMDELGDEFVYYIRDSIEDIHQFSHLILRSFKTAAQVFTTPFFEKLSSDYRRSCKKILLAMNSALFNRKNYVKEDVYFVTLFNKLKQVYGNTVYEQLQLLKETKVLNKELVLVLLTINDHEFETYIINEIKANKYPALVKELIEENNKDIIGFIMKLIGTTIKHDKDQNNFIKLLLNSNSEFAKESINSWIINNIRFFNKEDSKELLSDAVFDEIIFRKYIHKTVDGTKDLNKVIQAYYTKYEGKVFFLPKGMYKLGASQVKIEDSILVARSPKEIYAKGKNMNKVEMDAVNQYNKKLWTFAHMKVAYTFFELSPPGNFLGTFVGLSNVSQKGIIFEAYKENFIGILRLSGFQGKGNTLVNQSHYGQNNEIKENIIYREVYQIH